MGYSTNGSKEVIPVLILLFVALWVILRGNSKEVLLLQFYFVCASVVSYVAFVFLSISTSSSLGASGRLDFVDFSYLLINCLNIINMYVDQSILNIFFNQRCFNYGNFYDTLNLA